jgi:hypothetical protein
MPLTPVQNLGLWDFKWPVDSESRRSKLSPYSAMNDSNRCIAGSGLDSRERLHQACTADCRFDHAPSLQKNWRRLIAYN